MAFVIKNNKVLLKNGKVITTFATPFQLPNLKLYLSATRMFQYADNTALPSFLDYSGNNYHATQATASFQPLFKTNQFGSNAGIKFDGVNDNLNIGGSALDIFRNINQYTVQVLAKRSVLSNTELLFYVLSNTGLVSRVGIAFLGANIQIVVRRQDADPTVVIQIPSNDLNPHFIQATLNPTNFTVYSYLDGVLVNTTPLAGSGNLDNTACNSIQIGQYSPSSLFSVANINGISVNTSYSNPQTIQAQYRGYLSRGYL